MNAIVDILVSIIGWLAITAVGAGAVLKVWQWWPWRDRSRDHWE